MAKMKVIAHFMHEKEEEAAHKAITGGEITDSFIVGEIEESEIPNLESKGVIVQMVPQERDMKVDHEAAMQPSMLAEEGAPSAEPEVKSEGGYFIVNLNGPLLGKWRSQLEALNLTVGERIGASSFVIKASANQSSAIRNLKFVSALLPYSRDAIDKQFSDVVKRPAPPSDRLATITLDIRLHDSRDLEKIKNWLEQQNVLIIGAKDRKIRVSTGRGTTVEREIENLPRNFSEVRDVDEYIPPKLHNDHARVILGIDKESDVPTSKISQTGKEQIVGVADTGIDQNHPDFQNRIKDVVALGRQNDSSDPNGHGTHVAGSILGNGSASGGTIRGMAPEAKLVFQSIMDSRGGLGGLPFNLMDLFDEAYQKGARIHNNSWGASLASRYTFDSSEVDEFVWNHPDMLIIISAGNDGTDAGADNPDPGIVDQLSIGAPATCKNALTVGACRSDRTTGGYSQFTYGFAWPRNFPQGDLSNEKVSGDINAMAGFSSRGPCDDRRIKPDLVAPGTDILSLKSSIAPMNNYWGPYPKYDGNYAYLGGTSMAAPIVTGCAALVRQYYTDRGHTPSAALLKATLINSTKWLTSSSSIGGLNHLPNIHQGFGCVHMPDAVPQQNMNNFKLEFIDTWETQADSLGRTGERRRYKMKVNSGRPIRICLTWTDYPGRSLQNNLNLFLQHNPHNNGTKWIGNEHLPTGLRIPDPDNNIEVIRIDQPMQGEYMIQVSAYNILQSPQDFALVVTGDLTTGLDPYP